jgi:hypothetical protein
MDTYRHRNNRGNKLLRRIGEGEGQKAWFGGAVLNQETLQKTIERDKQEPLQGEGEGEVLATKAGRMRPRQEAEEEVGMKRGHRRARLMQCL